MKVLFVVHDLSYADHIAIAHLSSIAKQRGHSTFFCLLDRDDLTSTIYSLRADVVAYSVNVIGYQRTIEAHNRAIRWIEGTEQAVQCKSKFVSIMGGPQTTFSPETFPESGMDAYCVGEGEYPFRDFLARVEQGDSFDDIPNLITKKGANPVRPLIANLDELPPADRDLVISNSFLRDVAKKTFYASRGCPFQCTYCCNNYYRKLYQGKGPPVRRFSVERVIREIEDVRSKYRMEFIKFGDDCFTFKADDWLEEFSEKYSRRIAIPFNCYLRLDTVDDAMLKLLKRAGCFSVHLSVDSTSPYIREKVLKRQMRSDDIVERLRKIREYGINTWVNYMLAVPESTLQDDLDTIKLSKEGRVTYPAYSTTVPMEKTELYDYCVNLKLIDPGYTGDMSGCSRKSALSCFTDKDIRYNIYLLGALIAKMPWPLDKIAIALIKVIPPNTLFKKISNWLYNYYIKNKIFKLPGEKIRGNRFNV